MAVEILQVSAVGATNNWLLGAGANKVVAVNQPSDGDTSYIRSNTASGTIQQFAVTDSALPSFAVIQSVVVKAECKRGGTQNVTYVVSVISNGTTDGASRTAGAAYAVTTDTFNTRPAGGAWTVADVNALVIQIRNTQARDCRCTTFWVEVNYTLTVTNNESLSFTESNSFAGGSSNSDGLGLSEGTSFAGTHNGGEVLGFNEGQSFEAILNVNDALQFVESSSYAGGALQNENLGLGENSSFDAIADVINDTLNFNEGVDLDGGLQSGETLGFGETESTQFTNAVNETDALGFAEQITIEAVAETVNENLSFSEGITIHSLSPLIPTDTNDSDQKELLLLRWFKHIRL